MFSAFPSLPAKRLPAQPTPQRLGQERSAMHPVVLLLFISDVFLCCSKSWKENTRILKTTFAFFSHTLKRILPVMPSLIAKVQRGTETRKEQPQGKQLVSTGRCVTFAGNLQFVEQLLRGRLFPGQCLTFTQLTPTEPGTWAWTCGLKRRHPLTLD